MVSRRRTVARIAAFMAALISIAGLVGPAQAAPSGLTSTYTLFGVDAGGELTLLARDVSSIELASYPGLGSSVLAIRNGGAKAPSASPLASTSGKIYQCYFGTTVRQTTTPQDPRKCSGDYWVLTSSYQGIWHNAPVRSTSPLWTAVVKGYNATNAWCSNNSFVCGIVTSAGVAVVAAIVQNPVSS